MSYNDIADGCRVGLFCLLVLFSGCEESAVFLEHSGVGDRWLACTDNSCRLSLFLYPPESEEEREAEARALSKGLDVLDAEFGAMTGCTPTASSADLSVVLGSGSVTFLKEQMNHAEARVERYVCQSSKFPKVYIECLVRRDLSKVLQVRYGLSAEEEQSISTISAIGLKLSQAVLDQR